MFVVLWSGPATLAYMTVFKTVLTVAEFERVAWLMAKAAAPRGISIPRGLKSQADISVVSIADIPANVRALNGSALFRARQLDARITHEVSIREDDRLIKPDDIVEFEGRDLHVIGPVAADEMRREVKFKAREVVD